MPTKYVKKILDARIYDLVVETPIDPAPLLSQRLNNQVLLKREDLQPVFPLNCAALTTSCDSFRKSSAPMV